MNSDLTIGQAFVNAIRTLRADLTSQIATLRADLDSHIAASAPHAEQFTSLNKRTSDIEARFAGLEDIEAAVAAVTTAN